MHELLLGSFLLSVFDGQEGGVSVPGPGVTAGSLVGLAKGEACRNTFLLLSPHVAAPAAEL